MGRLSKRTLQCRAARRMRDLKESRDLKENLKPANRITNSLKASKLNSVINFNLLGEDSLLRYQQAYGLGLVPGSSREELVWAVQHHFRYQEVVDEGSLLYGFIQALKRDSSSDSSVSSLS